MDVEHPLLRPGAVEFRRYQVDIAKSASGRNTLVVLPTALGKTVISALVAADVLYRNRRSRILVMAPTRPLALQHERSFREILRLGDRDFALLTGKVPPERREFVWRGGARIVMATPEVVRNDALEGRLDLSSFDLLIFDEAHRAVGEYAYVRIADEYFSRSQFPLVLGMTASPGSTAERILAVCRNLRIERIEYRDEDDPDVRPYVHRIDMEWSKVELPASYRAISSVLQSMLRRRIEWLRARGYLGTREVGRRALVELGNELRYALEAESIEEERGIIMEAVVNQSAALTLFHMLELIETQGIHAIRAFMERMESEGKRSHSLLMGDPDYDKLAALVSSTREDHPKVGKLLGLVAAQLSAKPSSRMLIFTQYRDTVAHLVDKLNAIDGVRVGRFVGQSSREGERGMSQDEQAAAVRALEEGEVNVLVATSIAEEGLDIPAVDHVVFYEPIPSEIRYIQRRGRTGRRAPGSVTILAAEGTMDSAYLYASARKAKRMRWLAGSVNRVLRPVDRMGKPPYDPMTPRDLAALGEEGQPGIHRVAGAAVRRLLYDRILEAGAAGVSEEELRSFAGTAGIDWNELSAALADLIRLKRVKMGGSATYAAASALDGAEGDGLHTVEVKKVYPGFAVVTVDDERTARMDAAEFDGPGWLVKRGSRFLASADVRELAGELHVSVKRIVRKL